MLGKVAELVCRHEKDLKNEKFKFFDKKLVYAVQHIKLMHTFAAIKKDHFLITIVIAAM